MFESPHATHVLDKLYENQLALAAAVEELALWVETRAKDETCARNVRDALDTLDRNASGVSGALQSLKAASPAG